jgi:uncharacterized protein (DUF427 family)
MLAKVVKIPGPDHPITVVPNPKRVVVTVGGKVITDTVDALTLQEANYPAVHYVPREDVDMSALRRSETQTYCPYKGYASYFSIEVAGSRGRDAAWSYEAPHEAVASIRDRLAFYPDRVDVIEERD